MEVVKDLGIETTKAGYKKRFVIAKCGCGKTKKVALNSIKTGNTKSCGCGYHRGERASDQVEYSVLSDIKKRCYASYSQYYYLYGGRGIKVCYLWKNNSWAFINWCRRNGYKKGLYIDRINPDGNYEPSNCRFVDAYVNAANTRLLRRNNKSGFRGVSRHVKRNKTIKWRARIVNRNSTISLGVYSKKQDAANAYDNYIIKHKLPHPLNNKKKDKLDLRYNGNNP